jgi:SHS2 domain-containing protein
VAWKILDHTADAGFEAEADTLAEIFLDAAEAFLFIAQDRRPVISPKQVNSTLSFSPQWTGKNWRSPGSTS